MGNWLSLTAQQVRTVARTSPKDGLRIHEDFDWFRTPEGKPYCRYWLVVHNITTSEKIYVDRDGRVISNPHKLTYEQKQNLPEEEMF